VLAGQRTEREEALLGAFGAPWSSDRALRRIEDTVASATSVARSGAAISSSDRPAACCRRLSSTQGRVEVRASEPSASSARRVSVTASANCSAFIISWRCWRASSSPATGAAAQLRHGMLDEGALRLAPLGHAPVLRQRTSAACSASKRRPPARAPRRDRQGIRQRAMMRDIGQGAIVMLTDLGHEVADAQQRRSPAGH
jgi:hypothetical protein